MKRALAAAAALFLLINSACTPKELDDAFFTACTSVPVADAGFQLYAAGGKVKADVISAEQTAVAGAQAICNGPRPQDVNAAIAAVSRAITAISKATVEARAQAAAADAAARAAARAKAKARAEAKAKAQAAPK